MAGITVHVTVNPIKSGWTVELYLLFYPDFVKIATDTTDSAGKTSFGLGVSSYPITLKVKVPSGQVKDGIEYGGDSSGDLICYDNDVKYANLTLVPVTPPSPPEEEGEASITEINLPDELEAGESIIGTLKVKNIGAVKDTIRILITAGWIPKTWTSQGELEVGQTLTTSLVSGMVEMPNQDAHFTIGGQHWSDELGKWIFDDIKTH